MYVFDWKLRRNPRNYIWQSLMAMAAVTVILYFLDHEIQTALIASLGATSFIVFCSPHHFTSSPRNVLGGYAAGILAGITASRVVSVYAPDAAVLAGGAAVGASIFMMASTNTEHPPAAGIALGLVLNEWDIRTLLFLVGAALAMILVKNILKPRMINLVGEEPKRSGMKLQSPAFSDNGIIPEKYTADGEGVSPPLLIKGVPEEAKSLALVFTDYEGILGVRDHWVIWNILPDTVRIMEGEAPACTAGMNDLGSTGYIGPSPPSGRHTYIFKVYALDRVLSIPEGSKKPKLEKAMCGCIIDKAYLKGVYSRSSNKKKGEYNGRNSAAHYGFK